MAVFIPPACREEVLGDLHERFKSPLQYAGDASVTIPLVIMSRMRRTSDPQILLIQAFVLYMSFMGADWFSGGTILRGQWGMLRLAIPPAMAMLGLVLDDTYASPRPRSALNLARGPLMGLGLALASQGLLWIGNPALALPRWITFYGCAMSLLLSSAVRMLFPPITGQLQGVNAPAHLLKQAGGSRGSPQGIVPVLKGVAAVLALAVVGAWIAERPAPPTAGIVVILAVLVIAYQSAKRG